MNYEELLGCSAIDRLSKFSGIIFGFADYMTGCKQLLVIPNDSTKADGKWFDIDRLDIEKSSKLVLTTHISNGGNDNYGADTK